MREALADSLQVTDERDKAVAPRFAMSWPDT
jgi:hypothetical protein